MRRIENLMDLEKIHEGEMVEIEGREEQVNILIGSCLRTLSKDENYVTERRYLIGKSKIKNEEVLMKMSKEKNPLVYDCYNDLMKRLSTEYNKKFGARAQ